MLRKVLLMLGLLVLASLPARAQDKAELFGGFSYLRFNTSPGANLDGWEISGQYKFRDWLGGVGDFAGHYGSGASTYTYLFGPQISLPSRVSPFGHLLIGGAHFGAGGFGVGSFSLALGGGVDVGITDRISWRTVQLDYLLTQFGGASQNSFRLSTGVVFKF
jgi:hypothetical protein